MSETSNTVTMFVRDNRTLTVTVHATDGTPVDLTDAKVWFTVKARMTDLDSAAVIQKKNPEAGGSEDEIHVTDPSNGVLEIYLVPADTESVDPATYVYDVQVTLISGKTYTVVRDKITFKEDVTKAMT